MFKKGDIIVRKYAHFELTTAIGYNDVPVIVITEERGVVWYHKVDDKTIKSHGYTENYELYNTIEKENIDEGDTQMAFKVGDKVRRKLSEANKDTNHHIIAETNAVVTVAGVVENGDGGYTWLSFDECLDYSVGFLAKYYEHADVEEYQADTNDHQAKPDTCTVKEENATSFSHASSFATGTNGTVFPAAYVNDSSKVPPPFIPNAAGGVKGDSGKPMPTLLLKDLPQALQSVIRVLNIGAKKYARTNYSKVETERYEDAIARHLLDYYSGQAKDPETGESHLAHVVCCAMFLLERGL